MPARNAIKQYIANSYYHIYNRGVEKRDIFLDEQDCGVFLSYIKEYLLPKNEGELLKRLAEPTVTHSEKDKILKLLRLNNFATEIKLIAYCLMPNHFHFLIKQNNASSIDKFMNSLATRYTMYFNHKYKRVGSLYQSVYKAVLIKNDDHLLHLTRYIHKQALPPTSSQGEALKGYPSSYSEYIGKRKTEWLFPDEILKFFSDKTPQLSYKSFVSSQEEPSILKDLAIEDL